MKRYKDCMIVCNADQTPKELMDSIYRVAIEKGYEVKYQTNSLNEETLVAYLNIKGYPYSRLILGITSAEEGVSVLNIVPMPESNVSHIELEMYNEMLDIFTKDVFETIRRMSDNSIVENSEDYTIQDIIPKSFNALNCWLNNFPLSSHQMDTNRWYDFVISLHQNGENLSLEDLAMYLKETYSWNEEDILKIQLRLESHLDLLAYYDDNREC